MNNFAFLIIFCLTISCTTRETQTSEDPVTEKHDPFHFEYTTEAAPEWTELFYRKSGWFAADGIFSIPLTGVDKPGNEGNETTLLIFSDTYIGEVKDNKPLPGNKMVNNTIAYIDGIEPDTAKINFHYKQGPKGEPQTFFVPNNKNSKPGQYYWLGDGFINKEMEGQLHLFAYHVAKTGPNVFDFEVLNVSLLSVPDPSSPPFEGYKQLTTPFHIEHNGLGTGDLGAGVLVNTEWAGAPHPDEYVYVYGVLGDGKSLVAARVRPAEYEDFDKWSYWNGQDWSSEIKDVAEITNGVSNELSVTPLKDGRYLLVFQVMGISDKVGLRVGTSPVGPFGPIHEIWTVPEFNEPPGILPYNAKSHPNLSKPGELLISYNTITFNFWEDIQENAHIYRPRFIRLKSDALK
ncbi:hypothetical protein BH23BAC1_BH23BAC1_22140 [soil metagenome]